MAEIRVDPARRGGGGMNWVWIVLVLVVLIAIGVWLVYSGTIDLGGGNGTQP